jgi:excisionase family DNA binding protein
MSRARGSAHRALESRAGNAEALAQQPAGANQTLDQLPTLHSVPAVAQRLGVSEKSIRRYIKRGLLCAYKIGGQIRIAEEDLMAFLASCRLHKSDAQVE